MNGDIIPPKRSQKPRPVQPRPDVRRAQPAAGEVKPSVSEKEPVKLPTPEELALPDSPKPKPRRSRLTIVLTGIVAVVVVAALSSFAWYASALSPVNPDDESRQHITIEPGSSLSSVGELLHSKDLIKSQLAFSLHARFVGASANLQAGDYRLSPSESTQEIMKHLTAGSVDEFTLTFLPGATLRRLPGDTSERRTDIKSALLGAGYADDEIEAAFTKDYDHPLLADKPSSADLEGYIYGETYKLPSNFTVEQVLEHTFDHYYGIIEENDFIAGFKRQGLTLHEAITLASIIEREVSGEKDRKQVAQIFLDRLDIDMSLGADATFKYIADKENVAPSPDIDSPYNTRKYAGLPPGPIAVPGFSALQAVAEPADGDYLYFVSGDDGTSHFAHTLEEHGRNIRQYCSTLCFGE